jgi:hypothetical protein
MSGDSTKACRTGRQDCGCGCWSLLPLLALVVAAAYCCYWSLPKKGLQHDLIAAGPSQPSKAFMLQSMLCSQELQGCMHLLTPHLKSRKSTKVMPPITAMKIMAFSSAPPNFCPAESESCRASRHSTACHSTSYHAHHVQLVMPWLTAQNVM